MRKKIFLFQNRLTAIRRDSSLGIRRDSRLGDYDDDDDGIFFTIWDYCHIVLLP